MAKKVGPPLRKISKSEITTPFLAPLGERIYEMIGKPEGLGGTQKHSLAHVVIAAGSYSPPAPNLIKETNTHTS